MCGWQSKALPLVFLATLAVGGWGCGTFARGFNRGYAGGAQFSCPHCNSGLRYDTDFPSAKGGDVVQCPECSGKIRLSGSSQTAQRTTAPSSGQPSAAQTRGQSASGGAADQLAPRDPVTNRRTPNVVTIAEEIRFTESKKNDLLQLLHENGIQVDTSEKVVNGLKSMMQRLAQVSHVPTTFPWEVHFILQPEINAFTIGGGKLFFFAGLFGTNGLVQNDLECAAIMAHEIAHVACRHVPEGVTWQQYGQLFSKRVRKDKMYSASFTTEHEDEADRVGLLYMALAGYDPMAATTLWQRAHKKFGSDPRAYLYDHSLNLDRARKTYELGRKAARYYLGAGVVNPQYAQILLSNDLIDRVETPREETELSGLIEAGAETYVQHQKVKAEQDAREDAFKREHAARQKWIDAGYREYRCWNCKKVLWSKPGTRGSCPYCKAQLTIPR